MTPHSLASRFRRLAPPAEAVRLAATLTTAAAAAAVALADGQTLQHALLSAGGAFTAADALLSRIGRRVGQTRGPRRPDGSAGDAGPG